MSSAICFNLNQSKILSSGNSLTLYHTIQATLSKNNSLKEKEKCFCHNVFYPIKKKNHCLLYVIAIEFG